MLFISPTSMLIHTSVDLLCSPVKCSYGRQNVSRDFIIKTEESSCSLELNEEHGISRISIERNYNLTGCLLIPDNASTKHPYIHMHPVAPC
jgi:hypothetical protein